VYNTIFADDKMEPGDRAILMVSGRGIMCTEDIIVRSKRLKHCSFFHHIKGLLTSYLRMFLHGLSTHAVLVRAA
jgi:hypothetical protein